MRTVRVVAVALAALGFVSALRGQGTKPEAWGGVVEGRLTLAAVVQRVDPATREVTVKDDKGVTTTVVCGPTVRNFAQIRVGDTVTLQYQETVSIIAISGVAAAPSRAQSVDVTGAPAGARPAGTVVRTDEVLADVTAVDLAGRTVTLKGPLRTVTVEVDKRVKGFERLKVGDKVQVRVTRAMAIAVTAP